MRLALTCVLLILGACAADTSEPEPYCESGFAMCESGFIAVCCDSAIGPSCGPDGVECLSGRARCLERGTIAC